MRIIFVRHGHPDYARDCLTALGQLHAGAVAGRLKDEPVRRIFSSTCGRALETAAPLAEMKGLPVERCDFMREIRWGLRDGKPYADEASPWTISGCMTQAGESLLEPGWAASERFCRNIVTDHVQRVGDAFDEWMAQLGYVREGLYYRAASGTEQTVAVFSHGGSSAAMLSRLFNLPFPFVCQAMGPDYTGVTIVQLPQGEGVLAAPRFEVLNDARHIHGLQTQNVYGH